RDGDEAEAVAELGDQRAPRRVREMRHEQALAEHREAHRQPGRQARPEQRRRAALELRLAFAQDRLVDDATGRRRSLLGFLAFLATLVRAWRGPRGCFVHPVLSRAAPGRLTPSRCRHPSPAWPTWPALRR